MQFDDAIHSALECFALFALHECCLHCLLVLSRFPATSDAPPVVLPEETETHRVSGDRNRGYFGAPYASALPRTVTSGGESSISVVGCSSARPLLACRCGCCPGPPPPSLTSPTCAASLNRQRSEPSFRHKLCHRIFPQLNCRSSKKAGPG